MDKTVLKIDLPMEAQVLENVVRNHCEHNGVWDKCSIVQAFGFEDYETESAKTDVYPKDTKRHDHLLGLASEAGELCGKMKKIDRDEEGLVNYARRVDMMYELGDVLWYVAAIAKDLGFSLRQVAEANIDKLRSRAERGKIGGSGDLR